MTTPVITTTATQYPQTLVGYTVATTPGMHNVINSTDNNNNNNGDNNRYRCCCNAMHVKTGAFIVGVFQGCGLLLEVVLSIIFFRIGFLGIVLRLAAVILLFLGLKYNRPAYLIFNIVMQIIEMIGFLIVVAYSIYYLSSYVNDDAEMKFALILTGAALGFAIEAWFVWVLIKCYKYIRQTFMFVSQQQIQRVLVVQHHHPHHQGQFGGYANEQQQQQQPIPPPPGYEYCIAAPYQQPLNQQNTVGGPPPPSYADVTKVPQ